MQLEEFSGKNVQAGEPLTAEAWNQIIEGLRAVNNHLRTAVSSTLKVAIGNTDIDPAELLVTASRVDGPQVFQAVLDLQAANLVFAFSALPAGVYTVRVAAPGFTVGSRSVSLPEEEDIELTLVPDGAVMPSVFGQNLGQGLKILGDRAIQVARILDITGQDVAPANPGPDFADAPILAQVPPAGVAVPAAVGVSLVIAATLREQPAVEMPSLAGLSLSEARQALESVGLVLGEVITKKS